MKLRIVNAIGMIGNEIKQEKVVYYTKFDTQKAIEALKYHLYEFYVYDYRLATDTIPGWYKLRECNDRERAKGRFDEMMRVKRAEERAELRKQKANEKLQATSGNTPEGE